MNTETPQTTRPSVWQFSPRSLLLFAAVLAAMLSIMKLLQIPLLPSPILFFLALLLPVWLPLFFLHAEARWQRLRPLLALIPIGWYLLMLMRQTEWQLQKLSVVTLALGYCLAACALAFSARGRRHLINVPLWLALLASAWAIVSRTMGLG